MTVQLRAILRSGWFGKNAGLARFVCWVWHHGSLSVWLCRKNVDMTRFYRDLGTKLRRLFLATFGGGSAAVVSSDASSWVIAVTDSCRWDSCCGVRTPESIADPETATIDFSCQSRQIFGFRVRTSHLIYIARTSGMRISFFKGLFRESHAPGTAIGVVRRHCWIVSFPENTQEEAIWGAGCRLV